MTAETRTAIENLCREAGMPPEQMAQVIEVAGKFKDEVLQLRSAEMLADAWKGGQS